MNIKSIKEYMRIHDYCAVMLGASDTQRELAQSKSDPQLKQSFEQSAIEAEKYHSPEWHRKEYWRLSEELDKQMAKRYGTISLIIAITSILFTVLRGMIL